MTKVLYIEDNEDNIFMLKSRLERKAFEVIIAENGLDGYNSAVANQPDLILLDAGLPILDGYQAAQKLKSDERTRHIPIIMLTAHALASDKERALNAGADDYEPKPINLPLLLEKMTALLKKSD